VPEASAPGQSNVARRLHDEVRRTHGVMSQIQATMTADRRVVVVPLPAVAALMGSQSSVDAVEAGGSLKGASALRGATCIAECAARFGLSADFARRMEWWVPKGADDVARFFALGVVNQGKCIPNDLQRPLRSLLIDAIEACDAAEGHLLDAASLLPIASYEPDAFNERSLGALRDRSIAFSDALRAWLLPTMSGRGGTLRFLAVPSPRLGVAAVGGSRVYIASVVPNILMMLLVVRSPETGDTLVRVNCAHFAEHFATVVYGTSRTHKFDPLPPPILDDEMQHPPAIYS
jgi:hypothetical protein